MSYKLELHLHSCDASCCSNADVDTIVSRYLEAGYSGTVLTNHINVGSVKGISDVSWEERIAIYTGAYDKLCKAAEGKDFDVLFGAEVNFPKNTNHYLTFGLTEKFLLENEAAFWKIEDYYEAAKECGMLVFQAHPFRFDSIVSSPERLDGVEVYNGHVGHISNNDVTEFWAAKFGMRKSSGTDFHKKDQQITGGIITERRVTNNDILLETLLSGNYELIKTPI